MQFAFAHDDGQRYYEYEKAELILVGVSRTFKTPLAYLAFKNWFVANYPIVLGVDSLKSLRKITFRKYIRINYRSKQIFHSCTARQEYLKGNTGEYSSLEFVKRELNYAEYSSSKFQCPVTCCNPEFKPIEEIASRCLIKRKLATMKMKENVKMIGS